MTSYVPRHALASPAPDRSARGLGVGPLAVLTAVLLTLGLVASSTTATASIGALSDSRPKATVVEDPRPVNLGVKFSAAADGTIVALQFYRSALQKKAYQGSLWTSRGKLLAQVTFPKSSKQGWQTVQLSEPVEVTKGKTYVASYLASDGDFAVVREDFTRKRTQGEITIPRNGGVFNYSRKSKRPTHHNDTGSNYLVDVVLESKPVVPKPTVSPTPSATPSPTVSAQPPASPTATPTVKPTTSPTPTPTASSPTASPTPDSTPTVSPTPSSTPTATPTASPKPAPTVTATPTPTPEPTITVTPTPKPTPTATATPTPTPTPTPTTGPTTPPPDDALTAAQVEKVRDTRIFFAHRSVGGNVLDGLDDLRSQYRVADPETVNLNDRSVSAIPASGPALVDALVGVNGDPIGKLDEFADYLRSGVGDRVDVALIKFCYSDIRESSGPGFDSIDELFKTYAATMAELERAYPQVTFVYATIPVENLEIKGGRTPGLARHNANRARFNALVRAHAGTSRPLWDVARLESIGPDGSRYVTTYDGSSHEGLHPDYTRDGGHLNDRAGLGRKAVAAELVRQIAKLS